MLKETVSERLFEQFCDAHHVPFTRITPNGVAGHKHPDYRITCADHEVIVEVKEVGESESRNTLPQQPADQVRRMLHTGLKQIKTARGKHPALIVLYDDQSLTPIDSAAIHAGMYEQDDVRGQLITKYQNTMLSAVALLLRQPDHTARLDFFHNHFAKIPFDPDWLRLKTAIHYRLADDIGEWEAC